MISLGQGRTWSSSRARAPHRSQTKGADTMRGQRFGQIAAKWRIHSDLVVKNFIRMEVELTRGVPGPAWGENKAIWREQSFLEKKRFQAGGCDP